MIPARGGWVVQSVRHVTLSLSLDIDLRVMSSSVTLGPMLGMEPAFKKKRGGGGRGCPGLVKYRNFGEA